MNNIKDSFFNKTLLAIFILLMIGYAQHGSAAKIKTVPYRHYYGHTFNVHYQYVNFSRLDAESVRRIMHDVEKNSLTAFFGWCDFTGNGIRVLQALRDHDNLWNLRLSGNNLSDKSAQVIAEIIRKSSTLLYIELVGNNFGGGWNQILDALKSRTNIKMLDLQDSRLGSESAPAVAEILRNNPELTDINLRGNNFGEEWGEILQHLSARRNIRMLDLRDIQFDSAVIPTILEIIINNMDAVSQIYFDSNNFDPKWRKILNPLRETTSGLLQLDIRGARLGPEHAPFVVKMIRGELRPTGVGGDFIFGDVKSQRKPESLALGGNDFGSEWDKILKALKDRRRIFNLDIRDAELGAENAVNVAEVIRNNRGLNRIFLGKNNFGNEIVQVLEVLRDRENLTMMHIRGDKLGFEYAPIIAEIIRNNLRLTKIDLSGNNFGVGIIKILESLRGRTNLAVFNFDECDLRFEQISIVTEIVNNNAGLRNKTIDFSRGRLGSPSRCIKNPQSRAKNISDIIENIRNNPDLTSMNLAGNNFGYEGDQVLEALKNRTNLIHLDLQNNNLVSNAAPTIVEIVIANPGLVDLEVGGNRFDFYDQQIIDTALGYNRNGSGDGVNRLCDNAATRTATVPDRSYLDPEIMLMASADHNNETAKDEESSGESRKRAVASSLKNSVSKKNRFGS